MPLAAEAATTLTIATVNNPDMIEMQRLSPKFEAANPDIKLNWVTLEENILRQRITTDIATHAGGMDIVTVGVYEVPIWAKRGWLDPITDIPASYDLDDVLKPVLGALSLKGQVYALPFYAESQMTLYRTDLTAKAGVTMPSNPTWPQVAAIADKLNDPKDGVYGICLRGKAGWGENMGQIGTVVNGMGGRWFNMNWQPQLTSPQWENAVTFYVDLLRRDGPPGAVSNGYNETLALFAAGHCAIWVDATVSAGFLANPQDSTVVGKVGYAAPPYTTTTVGLALPMVVGARHSIDLAQQAGRREVHHVGDLEGLHQDGGGGPRLGQRAARHAVFDLRLAGIPEGGALCARGSGGDQFGGSQPSVAAASALYRHFLCWHP